MALSTPNLMRKGPAFHRKGIFIMLMLLLSAGVAIGDDIDDNLPVDTPVAVKAKTRQAIQNGMDSRSVIALTRTMLQHRFDELQIRKAHAILLDASAAGMPVQPLMNKAHEGMAKNVPPDSIIKAMQAVQARNMFAHKQAARFTGQPEQSKSLGQLLAASLAAGMSQKDVGKIVGQIQQHAVSMEAGASYELAVQSFQTMRDISRLGVTSHDVSDLVAQALSKGYNPEDMQSLRNAFMMQSQHAEPQEIAHAYTNAIKAGKGPPEGAASPGRPPINAGQGKTGSGSGNSSGGPGGSGGGGGSGIGSGNSGGGGGSPGGNEGSGSGAGGGGGQGSTQ